jgi:large subunit ribosomal protein L33
MAKKSSRVLVGLQCEESGALNYVVEKNKINSPDPLRLKKFSPQLKKHTWHKEKKKLG